MLLANLLRTLSDDEIAKVRSDFRLAERSLLLFERIASSPSSPPTVEKLTKAFRITKENLYRLCSEIVDECVRILAPTEEFATMKFFRSKYLYRPFVTELRRTEKELVRSNADKALLERFYNFAFNAARNFPTAVVDLDLFQELGMKWYSFQDSPPEDEDLFITMRVIFTRIAALPSHKKMTLAQMKEQADKLLEPYRKTAPHSTNFRARGEYFQAEWKACAFERSHEGIQWLEKSLHLARENREWFLPNWDQILEHLIAYEAAVFCGKASEGFEVFQKYYKDQTPETSRGALFLFRFARVSFLAREFGKVKEILNRLDQFQVVKSTPEIYRIIILLQAHLQLAEGDFTEAGKTIEEARRINSENYFLDYEVLLRGLETAITFKKGNLLQADHLVQRNIKWHRTRRIALSSSAWIYFYQMIGSMINFRMTGEPIRQSLIGHFINDFRSEYPDFFLLLEGELESSLSNMIIEKAAA